jgi:hydrogenase maturation protease
VKAMKKTLILGLGNILMGDEGVGVHVARALEKMDLPAGAECLDGGTGGFLLLEPMQQAERIIMIDAAADDSEPGTIRRITPRYSKDYPVTLTAHDIGVKDLLDVFHIQGDIDGTGATQKEIILYAITIDPRQTLSLEMSPKLAAAADETVKRIYAEL